MVKKKTNKRNPHVFNDIAEDNKVSTRAQSDVTLNNFNNENFNEALNLYNAINEGKIDLNPKEKNELIDELNLILNHFESSSDVASSKETNDIYKNVVDNENNLNHNFNKNPDYINGSDSVGHEKDYGEHKDIKIDKKLLTGEETNKIIGEEKNSIADEKIDMIVEEDVNDVLSVDEALTDLIDTSAPANLENDLTLDKGFDTSKSAKYEGDLQLFGGVVEEDVNDVLSVDEALTDLIDDFSNEISIRVNNVSMEFKVSKDKIDTLKEYFIRTVKRNKSDSKIITALDNVSFEIPKGDRVGIIGFNGAGKSTLLKVLSGVYDATEGTIETKGKIAPLLELGAGFDPNYTGKDNIFLNGAFLGYSEEFLKEKYDEILEFSELGDAINYHVKTYSSGMRAKLGFAIATIVEPDILILDEILSVGDISFRKKSADKIRSLINSGITVLLVSHSIIQIRDLCNKAIWIDEGKLRMYGEVNEVCDAYVKAANNATREQLKNIKLD